MEVTGGYFVLVYIFRLLTAERILESSNKLA